MTAERLSVVVPMHRTAANLATLLQRLGNAVPGAEVVLVDDACPERSADRATEIDRHGLDVGIVRVVPNVGQHAAVQIGASHATGDIAVVMDADLQDAPEDVPILVANLDAMSAVDAVCAARTGRYTSPIRQLTATGYRALVTALTRGRVPRDAGMFMAVRAESLARISMLGDPMAPLVPALAASGARLRAIPLQRLARVDGPSSYDTRMRLRVALRALVLLTPARSRLARRHRARLAALAPNVSVERLESHRANPACADVSATTYRPES